MNNQTIGGQAVIEGVMMKSSKGWAVAVRNPRGEIIIKSEEFNKSNIFTKVPFVRGFFILMQTLWLGMKAIDFSSKVVFQEEKSNPWSLVLSLILAFLIGTVLFILLPLYLTKLTGYILNIVQINPLAFNLVDGILRVIIFIFYVFTIALWPQMRRIFAYHGAEHKVINAFEAEKKLDTNLAEKHSRFHVRCGTSFIFIVLVISILAFSAIPSSWSFLMKAISRIILLPVIAGISYEILKLSSRIQSTVIGKFIIAPGLLFQRITTKEPDINQLEVAIEALRAVLKLETQNK
ncbi:MAG: DUF1385 domain-containing protein [Thermodesulfovibrio sp.]|nr:DUF1385 domain-containing protein [Thermodesulfovibrio sp.]